MRGVSCVLLVATASLLAGCASEPYRKEVGRLRAEVVLLDERVTQLERVNGVSSGPLSAASSSEPAASPEPMPAPSESANPAPSLKPSPHDIQLALKNAGFYQEALDGKMGPATRDAVKEFQRVHGLVDDGVVGRQTWAKLRAFVDAEPVKR